MLGWDLHGHPKAGAPETEPTPEAGHCTGLNPTP